MAIPAIKLEHRITWGNIISVLTTLVLSAITLGVFLNQTTQARSDVAAVQSDVKQLQDFRFSDNSRMVRVETLLEQILDEVKTRP